MDLPKKKSSKKKQGGFTAIEMVVVMALIAIVLTIGVQVYASSKNQSLMTEAKSAIERELVSAIQACISKHSPLQCRHQRGDENSWVAREGANITTPWGDEWALTSEGRRFTLYWPMPSTELALKLDQILENSSIYKHQAKQSKETCLYVS